MTLLFSDWGNATQGNVYPAGNAECYRGRRFMADLSGSVTKVTVRLRSFKGEVAYAVKMELRGAGDQDPPDAIEETSTTTIVTVAEAWTDYEFTFDGSTEVVDDTYAWVILYRTDPSYAMEFKADSIVAWEGAYDDTGVRPWANSSVIMDIKVEGTLPPAGFSQVGAIIG